MAGWGGEWGAASRERSRRRHAHWGEASRRRVFRPAAGTPPAASVSYRRGRPPPTHNGTAGAVGYIAPGVAVIYTRCGWGVPCRRRAPVHARGVGLRSPSNSRIANERGGRPNGIAAAAAHRAGAAREARRGRAAPPLAPPPSARSAAGVRAGSTLWCGSSCYHPIPTLVRPPERTCVSFNSLSRLPCPPTRCRSSLPHTPTPTAIRGAPPPPACGCSRRLATVATALSLFLQACHCHLVAPPPPPPAPTRPPPPPPCSPRPPWPSSHPRRCWCARRGGGG